MKYKESFIAGNVSTGRFIKPLGVVLHHTGDYTKGSIVSTFTNPKSLASAHCLGLKNGERIAFATDIQRTWHAGMSEFKGKKYCNNFMLGYEFQGDTYKDELTQDQIGSFIEWFIPRKEKHDFLFDWITDHKTVSPGRKVDLNPVEFEKVLTVIKQLYI